MTKYLLIDARRATEIIFINTWEEENTTIERKRLSLDAGIYPNDNAREREREREEKDDNKEITREKRIRR